MDPTALLAAVEGALRGRSSLAPARALRVVVHARTEAGYRSLRMAESAIEGAPATWAWAPAPSLTAWRALEIRREAVVVDALFGTVTDADGAPRADVKDVPSAATMEAVQDRGATHVVACPVTRRGQLVGMTCIDLRWGARGLPPAELWRAVVAAVGPEGEDPPTGPHSRAGVRETGDPSLPVVGPRTEPLYELLARFAATNETLLLAGDTGVGKTRIARWCHDRSGRADGPFITANLHAIPETLFEGELFGWRRGAHDRATVDRPGLVAEAEGGTLFLDEIDKLGLEGQAKLLQLLDDRTYRPLGARGPSRADVRFILATNRDLGGEVAAGRFRKDLYYRITVLPVRIPSLSERQEEVPAWARAFAAAVGATLEDGAVAVIAATAWEGNLRELDRVVRRARVCAPARGPSGGLVPIDADTVRQALAVFPAAPGTGLDAALRTVVDALADAVASGAPGFTLGDLDLLRGLVLEEAARRMPVADVYRTLGEHRLVDSRNHQAAFKRDVAAAHERRGRLVRDES